VATEAVDELVSFLHSGAGLPAELVAALVVPMLCATGVSRLSVDRVSASLRAALEAAEAFFPGAVRLDGGRRGEPVELRLQGQGLL
jgi:RNA 3'-terminal phosphate cyclase